MRRPSAFKKADIVRVMKAVQAGGLAVARIEVSREGLIVVVPGKPNEACTPEEGNEWDEPYNGEAQAEVR